ncbi:hypothetical protein BDZ45DRAFT_635694, partial [Acephala macrosclerotiorum]
MDSLPGRESFLLHCLGLASFAASFQFLFSRPTKISQGFGGHFQFPTNIGLLLSFLSFAFAVLDDIFPSSTLDRLKRTTRFIVMPLETTITLAYCLLYFAHKSLIVDSQALPLQSHRDIGFHLLPALFLIADHHVVPPKQVLRVRSELAFFAFVGFVALYGLWLEICHARNGFWPYPILANVGVETKAGLFAVIVAML